MAKKIIEKKYVLSYGGDCPVKMYLTGDEVIEELRSFEGYLTPKMIKGLKSFFSTLEKGGEHEFTTYPEPVTLICMGRTEEPRYDGV